MNWSSILSLLKSVVPILEPLGEQGVNQLWLSIDAEIAKISDSNDLKSLAVCLSPALKQYVLLELQKMK